jgi:hypothetical protein
MSRRGIMRTALKATAAAAIGGALVERAMLPAAASNGSNVSAGNTTTAEQGTTVAYDGAGPFQGVVLLGNDSIYGANSATYPAGLGGWAGYGATAGPGQVPNGVYGYTDNPFGNGIVGVNGHATDGVGVLGISHGTQNPIGVFGLVSSASATGGTAVLGQFNGTDGGGIGVYGTHAGSGDGVSGYSLNGVGVSGFSGGYSGTSIGVQGAAEIGVLAQGVTAGLKVIGPALFSRSGSVSIAAGAKTATVTGVSLKAASLVLATVQSSIGVWVAAVVPNVPGHSFQVVLNKTVPATKSAKVAWFVVN